MHQTTRRKARRRLDERLALLKSVERLRPPPKGWIRAIRDSLGMTGAQLAKRLGVRPQTVETIEKSEAAGRIQLDTLARAGAALDCRLVYALVPNTSLEDMVHARAHGIAKRELKRVAHTMKLEAQDTSDDDLEDRVEAYIRDVLKDRELWRDP